MSESRNTRFPTGRYPTAAPGSAAHAFGGGLSGITVRKRNLLVVGGAAALCFFVLWNMLSPNEIVVTPAEPASASEEGATAGSAPATDSPPAAGPAATAPGYSAATATGYGTTTSYATSAPLQPSTPAGVGARRSYAIGLHDLDGLPPDAAPGTRVELWVAWDPPVTEQTEVHKLIDDVVIEKLIPPVVPEGPVSVVLSIRAKDFSDLVWGDRYGALSVSILP